MASKCLKSAGLAFGAILITGGVALGAEHHDHERHTARQSGGAGLVITGDIRVGEDPCRGQAPFEKRSVRMLPEHSLKEKDRQLKRRIEHRLTWTPFVDADYFIVSVQDGVAILNGWVEDDSEMRDAVAQADRAGAYRVVTRLRKLYSHPDIPPPWYWLFPSVWETDDEVESR